MSKNFSINSIASVSGKTVAAIYQRAKVLGFRSGRKGYSIAQAHALVYYQPKKRFARTETVEQETSRLLATLQEMNIRKGKPTIIKV